ncbi:hypothetical protein GGI24_002380, partial [Coemansia furcata]
ATSGCLSPSDWQKRKKKVVVVVAVFWVVRRKQGEWRPGLEQAEGDAVGAAAGALGQGVEVAGSARLPQLLAAGAVLVGGVVGAEQRSDGLGGVEGVGFRVVELWGALDVLQLAGDGVDVEGNELVEVGVGSVADEEGGAEGGAGGLVALDDVDVLEEALGDLPGDGDVVDAARRGPDDAVAAGAGRQIRLGLARAQRLEQRVRDGAQARGGLELQRLCALAQGSLGVDVKVLVDVGRVGHGGVGAAQGVVDVDALDDGDDGLARRELVGHGVDAVVGDVGDGDEALEPRVEARNGKARLHAHDDGRDQRRAVVAQRVADDLAGEHLQHAAVVGGGEGRAGVGVGVLQLVLDEAERVELQQALALELLGIADEVQVVELLGGVAHDVGDVARGAVARAPVRGVLLLLLLLDVQRVQRHLVREDVVLRVDARGVQRVGDGRADAHERRAVDKHAARHQAARHQVVARLQQRVRRRRHARQDGVGLARAQPGHERQRVRQVRVGRGGVDVDAGLRHDVDERALHQRQQHGRRHQPLVGVQPQLQHVGAQRGKRGRRYRSSRRMPGSSARAASLSHHSRAESSSAYVTSTSSAVRAQWSSTTPRTSSNSRRAATAMPATATTSVGRRCSSARSAATPSPAASPARIESAEKSSRARPCSSTYTTRSAPRDDASNPPPATTTTRACARGACTSIRPCRARRHASPTCSVACARSRCAVSRHTSPSTARAACSTASARAAFHASAAACTAYERTCASICRATTSALRSASAANTAASSESPPNRCSPVSENASRSSPSSTPRWMPRNCDVPANAATGFCRRNLYANAACPASVISRSPRSVARTTTHACASQYARTWRRTCGSTASCPANAATPARRSIASVAPDPLMPLLSPLATSSGSSASSSTRCRPGVAMFSPTCRALMPMRAATPSAPSSACAAAARLFVAAANPHARISRAYRA